MHLFLLLGWTAIATLLRFTNLTAKPPWADEFSTLVFSLGNSFLTIPLGRALSVNELLQPLQPAPAATIGSVVQNLLIESNHPPLFFVLTHLWLTLFPPENGLVSLGAARAFAAMCGVVSVPAAFGLGWLVCRSRLVGQLAAAFMALSPFGIYLAQEARHYTLATLWIIASLACFMVATRRLQTGQRLPLWLCLLWIAVNGLGIATHYFVLLTLLAEAIALILYCVSAARCLRVSPFLPLRRLTLVAVGTIATALVWLPVLQNIRGGELTRWLRSNEFDHSSWIEQLARFGAGLASMIYLLPIQGVPQSMAIASGVLLVGLLLWTVPLLVRGWLNSWLNAFWLNLSPPQSPFAALSAFVIAAIALSFLLTFGLRMNVASVFRYQFFYFPAVIVLVAVALADVWQRSIALVPGAKWVQTSGKWAIGFILLCSLLGGLTVVTDWGYQKTHRPTEVAAAVAQSSQHPALVAILHRTHGQTGRLMAIAWELRRISPNSAKSASFLLAHTSKRDPQAAIDSLQRALASLPRPLDVWRVNFRSEANPRSHAVLVQQGCSQASKLLSVDGYRYGRYECRD